MRSSEGQHMLEVWTCTEEASEAGPARWDTKRSFMEVVRGRVSHINMAAQTQGGKDSLGDLSLSLSDISSINIMCVIRLIELDDTVT